MTMALLEPASVVRIYFELELRSHHFTLLWGMLLGLFCRCYFLHDRFPFGPSLVVADRPFRGFLGMPLTLPAGSETGLRGGDVGWGGPTRPPRS